MDSKVFWIYGVNPVAEAVKSGRKIDAVYVQHQAEKGKLGMEIGDVVELVDLHI